MPLKQSISLIKYLVLPCEIWLAILLLILFGSYFDLALLLLVFDLGLRIDKEASTNIYLCVHLFVELAEI